MVWGQRSLGEGSELRAQPHGGGASPLCQSILGKTVLSLERSLVNGEGAERAPHRLELEPDKFVWKTGQNFFSEESN